MDLDNRLGFVKTPVIFRVASESVSQQGLQGLGRAEGASAHSTGDDAADHGHHQHRCDDADGDDLRQGVSPNCGGRASSQWVRRGYTRACVCTCRLLTWPLDLVGVSQVFRSGEKHLSVGDGRPKRNHVESPVVPDRSVLLGVDYFTCRMRRETFLFFFSIHAKLGDSRPNCSVYKSVHVPGWCLPIHSSKIASVKVCSRTKMGSLGER